jgi:hypothetical protein
MPVAAVSPVSRARFTGGADVRVRNVSGRGLLAVGDRRVPPGRVVAVAWPDVAWLPRQRAMVARCFVSRLLGDAGIEYGVALEFAAAVPELRELATRMG